MIKSSQRARDDNVNGASRQTMRANASSSNRRRQQQQKMSQVDDGANQAANLPLRCICNLCNCGGHKCADFSWANGGAGATNGSDHQQHVNDSRQQQQQQQQQQHYLRDSSRASMDERNQSEARAMASSPRCQQHSNLAHGEEQMEERYLTSSRSSRASLRHRTQEEQQQDDHLNRYGTTTMPRSHSRNGQRECGAQTDEDNEGHELLHVLVTRPEIASKPRDNIVFEGDMDLRTTFETSYEALARMRLEHWKRHQELQQQQQQQQHEQQASGATIDVSDRATTRSVTNGGAGSPSEQRQLRERARRSVKADADETRSQQREADDRKLARDGNAQAAAAAAASSAASASNQLAANNAHLNNARMIKSPARLRGGDSLAGTGLALGQPAAAAAAAAADVQLEQPQKPIAAVTSKQRGAAASYESQRRQQKDYAATEKTRQATPAASPAIPFVDPDLSPIIVYDANLNRLERVGLRKRSKYRPSTSLRPGGRNFFGQPSEETTSEGKTHDGETGGGGGGGGAGRGAEHKLEKRGIAANNDLDEVTAGARHRSPASPGGGSGGGGSGDIASGRESGMREKAAGDTSENLNRDRNAGEKCGRKHNLNHVNRIDHIKQFNLVESSQQQQQQQQPLATTTKEFSDKATLTTMDAYETQRQASASATQTRLHHKRSIDGSEPELVEELTEDERRLALEEDAAALAEIQRVTLSDHTGAASGAAAAAAAGAAGAAGAASQLAPRTPIEQRQQDASQTARDGFGVSPLAASLAAANRQARLQRVCQNQSFNIHENEYPEVSGGALSEKQCIKIGGRETVDLTQERGGQTYGTSSAASAASQAVSSRTYRQNKNLFRESPDFILTTTATNGQHARDHLQQQQRHSQVLASTTARQTPEEHGLGEAQSSEDPQGRDPQRAGADSVLHDAAGQHHVDFYETDAYGGSVGGTQGHLEGRGSAAGGSYLKCRVLDLSHDFEFVGSQSGHKYFVEKNLDETLVMSEMS